MLSSWQMCNLTQPKALSRYRRWTSSTKNLLALSHLPKLPPTFLGTTTVLDFFPSDISFDSSRKSYKWNHTAQTHVRILLFGIMLLRCTHSCLYRQPTPLQYWVSAISLNKYFAFCLAILLLMATLNKAAVAILHTFRQYMFSLILGQYLGIELRGHKTAK